MRTKTKVLAGVAALTALYVAWSLAQRLEAPLNYVVLGLGVASALSLAWGFVVRPERQLGFLREIADTHGFRLAMADGNPHLMGTSSGRAFAISVITRPASNLLGFETAWIGTWTLDAQLPSGFRVHRRSETSWYHALTGANEVRVDALKELMIEGVRMDEILTFTEDYHDDLKEIFSTYPRSLLSGADPMNVLKSEERISGGTLTIVTKPATSVADLELWLANAAKFSDALERVVA